MPIRLALPTRLFEASLRIAGEQEPGQHAGEHQDGIGRGAVARQLGEPAEHDREDHHGQERPDHRPGDADDGLLVAHRDVAPGQDREQLAIGPEVAPIVALGAAGLEDEHALAPRAANSLFLRHRERHAAAAGSDELEGSSLRITAQTWAANTVRPNRARTDCSERMRIGLGCKSRLRSRRKLGFRGRSAQFAVGECIPRAADAKPKARRAAGHRLEEGNSESLARRGHDEEVGHAIGVDQDVGTNLTHKAHTISNAETAAMILSRPTSSPSPTTT